MSEITDMKIPCDECHRIKSKIIHCEEHDSYYCSYCKCFDCADTQTKILLIERQIDRKQCELSCLYIELNHLKKIL